MCHLCWQRYDPLFQTSFAYELLDIFRGEIYFSSVFTSVLWSSNLLIKTRLLQHQRQECTIGQNSCFWLLNCTKGNGTKGKKKTPLATAFLTCTISNNKRFNGKTAWKNCRKIRPLSEFFSSNITNSIIVVTNMAAFQCNCSIICILKKLTN